MEEKNITNPETIISRLLRSGATLYNKLEDVPDIRENEVTAKEFVECLETLFLIEDISRLQELRDACTKPVQKLLYNELVDSTPQAQDDKFYQEVDAIQSGTAVTKFLCQRGATLVDLANENGERVADYDFSNPSAYMLRQMVDESYGGKVTDWCKEALGMKTQ